MNPIKLRRIALSVASVSFGILWLIILLWSSIFVSNGDGGQGILPATVSKVDENVELPATISCTPLIVEKLSVYDGNFIEDGSNEEVIGVAAALLRNCSEEVIPYAFVTIYTEHCKYTFDAFVVPPKSTVLVPDSGKQKLTECSISRIFGWVTVSAQSHMDTLEIVPAGEDALWIRNPTGKRLEQVTLYHRTYISEGHFYLGGRAFSTILPELPPGGTVMIWPENYALGSSRVVYYD